MRHRGICWMFLFFASCLSACSAQNAQNTTLGEKEEKKEDDYSWDFGKVKEGSIMRHTFTFKNETKKILTIKGISTSCGCTVSKTKKDRLSPGEETSIEVSFNSKGYSGEVTQYIYVYTDDLDKQLIRFIIKANVTGD
ncbi:MAG: DUF1573 domain-containing protein [Candidatus Omnitrophica bacterium]|nr:DUF1573 domain-containing protein [Candidatus Omnitrophota bacterium]